MPRGPSPQRALLLLLVSAWLGSGCAAPGATRIVGPDGSPMAHVHCGADQAECFRLAGELCPTGYDMQPVLRGNDGNFLVRCRAARVVAAAPEAAPPPPCPTLVVSASADPPRGKSETWPPSGEPWTTANPWQPPGSAGAAKAPATQELDLGY